MKKRLSAHLLIDRSGSMITVQDETISAVNEYLSGVKAKEDVSTRVSLTLFDSGSIDLILDGVKVKDATPLTEETYVPRGTTPLNDAIGQTVTRIDGQTLREGENVALVIVTDGEENSSTEYSRDAVRALIEDRQKNKNWLVIFLGANIDAFSEGVMARGTKVGNTMQFDPGSIQASMRAAARGTVDYAVSGIAASADFTSPERAASVARRKKYTRYPGAE